MRNKKGISPLIATVLLIGFTIVLAALVIRWGSELFSGQIKSQTCENEATLECTSDVDLEITNVKYTNGAQNFDVAVVSNGKKNIDKGIIFRLHKENGEVESFADPTATLDAYAANTFALELLDFGSPTSTEIDCLDGAVYNTGNPIPDRFCGISVIPQILHTTEKGDSCESTCGQSEKQRAFDSLT